jgi:hypothetical protein
MVAIPKGKMKDTSHALKSISFPPFKPLNGLPDIVSKFY